MWTERKVSENSFLNKKRMSDLVCCLTNENLEFQYDVLESVINKPELLDIPIVIYSIAGPERTGKSFILNVFWYLLKNHSTYVDEPEDREVELPQVFQSILRPQSVTKGVFMTVEPVILFADNNAEIAVFLMDTQGIQSGDRVKCKEGDIFAISLTLSYMQIINVSDRLKYPDIDTYAALTLYGKIVSGLPTNEKNLTILIRDWIYEDLHRHGYDGGQNYYQKLWDEIELKNQLQCLKNFYKDVNCFLTPCPGKLIERSNSKRGRDIDQDAWLKMLELKQNLFSAANIQIAFNTAPKGKSFLCLARQLHATLAENRLAAPESSFQNFFDLKIMSVEISNSCKMYKEYMEKFTQKNGNDFKDIHKAQRLKLIEILRENSFIDDMTPYVNILHQHISREYEELSDIVLKQQLEECLEFYKELMQDSANLKGEALMKEHNEKTNEAIARLLRQNPIQGDSELVEQFRSQTYAHCEIYIGRQMSKDFASEWVKNIEEKGNFEESEIWKIFTEEGEKFVKKFCSEIKDKNSLSLVLGEFIETLNSTFHKELKRRRKNKTIAVGVGATFGGLIAGGLFVFIPPLGAAAVLATELSLTMISGGIGVAGASLTGSVSAAVTHHIHSKQTDIPPDLWKHVVDDADIGNEQRRTEAADSENQSSAKNDELHEIRDKAFVDKITDVIDSVVERCKHFK